MENAESHFNSTKCITMFMKKVPLFMVLLAMVLTIHPFSTAQAQKSILKIRNYADIAYLDPIYIYATPESITIEALYRKLITYKPGHTWEWELDAAEAIKQVNPTHVEFTLKKGIMFADGFGEMTAEDVKFSLERHLDPDLGSYYKGEWENLDHVEVTGKYSGTIILKAPAATLWTTAMPSVAGHIVSKKAIEKTTNKYFEIGGDKDYPKGCSGPYKFGKWVAGDKTILVKNEVYNGAHKPEFDEIWLFPIDDAKTAEMVYEAGDIDYTWISASSYASYKAKPPKNTTVENRPSIFAVWLGMNKDNTALKDIRVRKAIQYAVDVPSIIKATYAGLGAPATGMVAKGIAGYREKTLIPPQANVAKAKALLKEAGVKNLFLTVSCQNISNDLTTAQIIQANLAQVGITLQINQYDEGTFWTLGEEASGDTWKDLQLVLQRWSSDPDPNYMLQYFNTKGVGFWNWERFSNPEYDKLLIEGYKELDPAKRAPMYQRMQDLMEESGCYLFLTNETTPMMYRDTIVPGLRPDGIPLLHFFKKN